MELEKIIEALKEKEVDSAVVDAIKALDQTDAIGKLTKDLEAEQGKHAGILEDKKKFKVRAETAEKTLKEHTDKELTIEERTQNQIDELNKRLEDADKDKIQRENDFKAKEREAVLADITSSIKWSDSIPHDTSKLIVKDSFGGIDDLGDKVLVDRKIKELTETHKAFISADAPGGSGGKSGHSGESGNSEGVATMKELMGEIWQDK